MWATMDLPAPPRTKPPLAYPTTRKDGFTSNTCYWETRLHLFTRYEIVLRLAIKPTCEGIKAMSNVSTIALLGDIQSAAKSEGKDALIVTRAIIAAVTLVTATDNTAREKEIVPLRDAYYLGGMQGMLGLSEAKAAEMIARSPYDAKKVMTDENRSPEAQRAFDTLKTRWMRHRIAAGLPRLKVMSAPSPKEEKPVDAPAFTLTVDNVDTVGLFDRVNTLSVYLRKLLDANSGEIKGEAGSVLRGAITDLALAVKDCEAAFELDGDETTAAPLQIAA